ncbi:Leucine-rich repeat receptor kinase-like protein [Zea mays]|uniref:Leucine-rich repeat receptor kinase-like protein n=1 Tax=Zea mays TaxID=4577 RepID=A0A1D6I1X1_MAIZE|nr:Leucine-rich repeat receptor kinase-like protein [Zea mays]
MPNESLYEQKPEETAPVLPYLVSLHLVAACGTGRLWRHNASATRKSLWTAISCPTVQALQGEVCLVWPERHPLPEHLRRPHHPLPRSSHQGQRHHQD